MYFLATTVDEDAYPCSFVYLKGNNVGGIIGISGYIIKSTEMMDAYYFGKPIGVSGWHAKEITQQEYDALPCNFFELKELEDAKK